MILKILQNSLENTCDQVPFLIKLQASRMLLYSLFRLTSLKLVSAISSFFYFFHQMVAFKNCEKCFLFHLRSSFHSRDIQIFVFLSFLFLPVGHCFTGWSKISLKVHDIINCLNKNSITHFVWYLEKEKQCDIETLSIDGVSDKEHFRRKIVQKNVQQKLVPDLFKILVNNPKQPLHVRNCFKSKIFWKWIIKKP